MAKGVGRGQSRPFRPLQTTGMTVFILKAMGAVQGLLNLKWVRYGEGMVGFLWLLLRKMDGKKARVEVEGLS